MGCFSADAPQAPGPTAQEIELQQMQIDALKKQNTMNEQFQPFILESLGFKQDEQGNMVKIEEQPDELETLYRERQLQALRGELDISPALEKSLNDQQAATAESLSQRLGPDWQQTTAGSQAMSDFQERAGLLREEARRGQITTGEGLLQSRGGYLQGQQQTNLSNLGAFGAAPGSSQFQSALQPFQFNRNLQTQALMSGGQSTGLMGLIGTGVGAAAQYKFGG